MKKLLFIVNPNAGRTAIKPDIFEIILIFQKGGYEVTIYPTTGPEDAERKCIADGADYDLIVCAGGDGTLNNTIRGYMGMGEKKTPIGYIPVGTTNDFARSLKISTKPQEAAQQIMNGVVTPIDVGKIGDKNFIYIAAFGLFTDISYSTKQSVKKVIGHSAYILEAAKSLASYKAYKLTASLDDKVITGEYILGMITNSFSVAGFKVRGTKHVILDDGKFDCIFIRKPTKVEELQQVVSAFLSNEFGDSEMFFMTKASKVTITSEEEIPWTIDGEFGGSYKEIEINNLKQALGITLDPATHPQGISIYAAMEETGEEPPEEELFDEGESYSDGWDD